jgi:hypothetical protein
MSDPVDPNWMVNRLPRSNAEHDAAVEYLYVRLGKSTSEVGQLSLATRLQTLLSIRLSDTIRLTSQQMDASTTNLMKAVGNLERTFDTRTKEFMVALNSSNEVMGRWTVVLAIATGILALFALPPAIDIIMRWWRH